MTGIGRRGFLGAVMGGAALGAGPLALAAPASAAEATPAAFGPATVAPDDPRYASLVRGTNHRFVGTPDHVRLVGSTAQVVDAVNEAVAAGRRIAVRSGGHCFENFTASPEVRVLVDLSELNEVRYDPWLRAFSIQAGATLGHVYRTLFKGWGVTVPAGITPEVGVGGHFAGGGYGAFSRRLGSVVDYLYAVEVVTVDASGRARAVLATKRADDPHRDLWWAHTGGGGGNFGVVTKYWVRSPGATGGDPATALPKAPSHSRTGILMWPWSALDQSSFTAVLRNLGAWCERNSAPGSPALDLFPFFQATGRAGAGVFVGAQVDDAVPDSSAMLNALCDEVAAGVGVAPVRFPDTVYPWLYGAAFPDFGDPGTIDVRRFKIKAAYLRKGFTEPQLAVAYRFLSQHDGPVQLLLAGYGGEVNRVAPHATAIAQRDSILKAMILAPWASADDDDSTIAAVRGFYRDLYAHSGGVPVPDANTDGSYINYPDVDLADPAWNTSGVPWHTFYYKDNYPRLQQVKKRYDPRNVFRHALSIELPE